MQVHYLDEHGQVPGIIWWAHVQASQDIAARDAATILAGRWHCPPELYEKLSGWSIPCRRALARNYSTPTTILETLGHDHDPATRYGIAWQRHLNPATYRRLADEADGNNLHWNPADAEDHERWTQRIKKALAANPAIPTELYDHYFDQARVSAGIAAALSNNPNTDWPHLEQLADYLGDGRNATAHRNCPDDAYQRYLHGSINEQVGICKNPTTTAPILIQLSNAHELLIHILAHPACPVDLMVQHQYHADRRITSAIAGNRHCPVAILQNYALGGVGWSGISGHIRQRALANPHMPLHTIMDAPVPDLIEASLAGRWFSSLEPDQAERVVALGRNWGGNLTNLLEAGNLLGLGPASAG